MSVYSLTPLAKSDIFDIWSYIAGDSDSEETANRVEQAIYDACAFVAEAPMRGHTRSDLTSRPFRDTPRKVRRVPQGRSPANSRMKHHYPSIIPSQLVLAFAHEQ